MVRIHSLFVAPLLLAPMPAQEPSLVLRSTTRLVQVNVVVQDKNGRPVANLKKEDFVLRDNGKTQEIRIFSVESKDQLYAPAAQLPPNVFSNRLEQRSGAPANVTAILLDGLNTKWGDQAVARQQIIRYLERLQPQDRVGLYTLGREHPHPARLHHRRDHASEIARPLPQPLHVRPGHRRTAARFSHEHGGHAHQTPITGPPGPGRAARHSRSAEGRSRLSPGATHPLLPREPSRPSPTISPASLDARAWSGSPAASP